ncbi:protein-L-isoaspartate(D-aspartate) O-methyltransferase [Novosphingobium malaysiense]|uniref:Protein-L-isoaspartate O-methyltransferase n=1 Tax=Novosphingobium malaysiense TaxID=1348853 RepID=A0A0B1ZV00_9SPHN|nr:protein-L-isoaspartate(D-aspartate) O-methyltransferase [Novosphingobium malaysiense]KHK92952.1 protein-L-isoaspartate O-methyltransferase [Novosphingobium malaysiense]
MANAPSFEETQGLRDAMVERQIRGRGISDERLLNSMRQVPRHMFVDEDLRHRAYDDSALPIAAGQTISQPYIVARMIAAAEIGPQDRVLEVGLGSGYAAAVMSRMSAQVFAIDRIPELVERAREILAELGYDNIKVCTGDGTSGWPEMAPFDVIVASAGAPQVPPALLSELAPGGRLVIPVGDEGLQRLLLVRRVGPDAFEESELEPVRFVPLIGEHGWSADPGA